MTETARKIMEFFEKHEQVKAGMVVPFAELLHESGGWGPQHAARLEAAMEELRDEGYVIITTPHGLELTERGFSYLFAEG